MTPGHRRYFAVEMAIAALINAVLSAGFVFLVFGGHASAPVAGWGGIAADAAPQSFMIVLMSCLVPTLLTRRRMGAGVLAPLAPAFRVSERLAIRALLLAVTIAVIAVAVQAWLLPRVGAEWDFATVLTFKCVYGALLGAAVAAFSIRAALGERRA